MSNILSPERTRATSHRAAVTAACTAVGVTPPTWPADDLNAALAAFATLDSTRAAIGAEVRNLDTFSPEWVADAVSRIATATAADQLRRDSAGAMAGRTLARNTRETDEAARLVDKKVTKALDDFAALAAALVDGAPLDDTAAVAAGVGTQLKAARETLARLGTAAEIHRPWTRLADNVLPEQRPGWRWLLCALVDVDAVEVEQRTANQFGHKVLNPSTARDSIRRMIADAGKDLDRAVIDVARGRYEGARLSWAADRATLYDRTRRLSAAEGREMVNVAPTRRPSPEVLFFDALNGPRAVKVPEA